MKLINTKHYDIIKKINPSLLNYSLGKNRFSKIGITIYNDEKYKIDAFVKYCKCNFSKHSKNIENMKFEVFKNPNRTENIKAKTTTSQNSGLGKIKTQSDKTLQKENDNNPKETNENQKEKMSNLNYFKQTEVKSKSKKDHLSKEQIRLNILKFRKDKIRGKNIPEESLGPIDFKKVLSIEQVDSETFEKSLNETVVSQEKFIESKNNKENINIVDIKINETNVDQEKETFNISNLNSTISAHNPPKKNLKDIKYDESLNNDTSEEDNFNEQEMEYLSQTDKIKFGEYNITNDAIEIKEDYNLNEVENLRDQSLIQLELYEKESSEEERTYENIHEIMNLYENDPIYRKAFEETKTVKICEMKTDLYFWIKNINLIQSFSTGCLTFLLVLNKFSLPFITTFLFISLGMMKIIRATSKNAVIKILANPLTLKHEVFQFNLIGLEFSRSYSIFNFIKQKDRRDLTAYKFDNEDLISYQLSIQKFCNIYNENFFSNLYFINSKNYDNEFLLKYFHLSYSFTKKKVIDDKKENPDSVFKQIVSDYFLCFHNYNVHLKENINKLAYYDADPEKSTVIIIYATISLFLFVFQYLVYKYFIQIYFHEVEGGIRNLYMNK